MAWASPMSGCCASWPSRRRSTAELCRRLKPGSIASPPRPSASSRPRACRRRDRDAHQRLHLRYAGTDTALVVPMGALGELQDRLRGDPSPALRLRRAGQGADRRSALGRAGRQDREAGGDPIWRRGARADWRPRQRCGCFIDGAWQQDARSIDREEMAAGERIDGPGHHRRAHRHHRAGAGLAGGDGRARPSRAAPPSWRSGARPRSAPLSIRSCWRSSTISSCRSPSRWARPWRTPAIR